MLTGGFNNGQFVKVVEHTGVREQPEVFTTHEEADTKIMLHTFDLATRHSRLIVRCDDTDRLVFLISYHGKCMFANCKVYMNAEVHSCQQDSIDHLVKCLALPANQPHTIHQRYNGCNTTSSLFEIGKRIAYNMFVVNIGHLLSLAEVGQSSGVTNGFATVYVYIATVWCEDKLVSVTQPAMLEL